MPSQKMAIPILYNLKNYNYDNVQSVISSLAIIIPLGIRFQFKVNGVYSNQTYYSHVLHSRFSDLAVFYE
jgi:hypothetical protein